MNEHVTEDLTRLRDELVALAFAKDGSTKDSTLAMVVFKINSCLGKGYPRRNEMTKVIPIVTCDNDIDDEGHTCPYREEIHYDYTTLCHCDAAATRECAQDI